MIGYYVWQVEDIIISCSGRYVVCDPRPASGRCVDPMKAVDGLGTLPA